MADSFVKVNLDLYKRIKRALALESPEAKASHVKVGILAQQGGNEPHDGDDELTMIELWAIHEFGATIKLGERTRIRDKRVLPARSITIPARRPLRATFDRGDVQTEMSTLCGQLATKFVQGMKYERVLGLIGAWAVGRIKDTIANRLPPPNAKSTIDAKGSDKPLVDTGRLINALSWKVFMGLARDERGRFTGGRFDQ